MEEWIEELIVHVADQVLVRGLVVGIVLALVCIGAIYLVSSTWVRKN